MWWFCGLYCGEPSPNCSPLVSHANEQVTFSNPPEVAKTRLQLQGELAKGGGQKVYKNAIDVFAKTWRNEGIRGLQRGLGAAVSSPSIFVASPSHFFSMHTRQALSLALPLSPCDPFPDPPQWLTLRYVIVCRDYFANLK